MLKNLQKNCVSLIDEYICNNEKSLENIRVSVREIKLSCIKVLDDLKDKINIKNIVCDEQIFKDFDITYKNISKTENEKFTQRLRLFQQLNRKGSNLVMSLVEKIISLVFNTLNECLNNQQYETVKNKLTQMTVKSPDLNSIINYVNNFKRERNSFEKSTNYFMNSNIRESKYNINNVQTKNSSSFDNYFSDELSNNVKDSNLSKISRFTI